MEWRSDGKLSVVSLSKFKTKREIKENQLYKIKSNTSEHDATVVSIGNKMHCEKECIHRVKEKQRKSKEKLKDTSVKIRANDNIKGFFYKIIFSIKH